MTRRPDTPIREGAEPPPTSCGQDSRVIQGDVLEVLRDLPTACTQAVVTSPPYWGLRDYGLPPTVWGGDPDCRHRWDPSGKGRLCRRCRAWKGCLGLEPHPDLYVAHLVEVMREVRRCLRPDGTLWLNLGDSFSAASSRKAVPDADTGPSFGPALKPKDLVGIPWRVAFALQADGWWLRAENIWNKPNAMPESVRDRPTRAHEYVFLLSPSARYFYDYFAVREPDKGRCSGTGYIRPQRPSFADAAGPRGQAEPWVGGGGRNRRSVWTITTQCFRGAHFATFPEALVEVCVLAGTSPVACRRCGAPWRRVVESTRLRDGRHELSGSWASDSDRLASGRSPKATGYSHARDSVRRETVGWTSGCDHDDPGARCTVLDPFAGSGTTGLVAARHGRNFLGAELSRRYTRMARSRLREGGIAGRQPAGRGRAR